jgi:hypothetical protein
MHDAPSDIPARVTTDSIALISNFQAGGTDFSLAVGLCVQNGVERVYGVDVGWGQVCFQSIFEQQP